MEETLDIDYRFAFASGETKEFSVRLDAATLHLAPTTMAAPPAWTALTSHQCPGCPVDPATTACCPVALNMAHIVEEFKEYLSYDEVAVTVTTAERSYSKETCLQLGLSPLLGIVMVSSGCPTMEQLKPMVRFHLPFASLEETAFRSVAMYLVSLYYRQQRGESVDWSLAGLEALYAEVGAVNTAFAERLRAAAKKDANVNALVSLHCLGEMVPPVAEEMLEQLQGHFAALL